MALFILCDDLFVEITSYLHFEDKIALSNALHKSCFIRYNFAGSDFQNKRIDHLFSFYKDDDEYDDYCDYLCDISTEFIYQVRTHYDNYHGLDIAYYMNDFYNNLYYRRTRELYELFHDMYMTVYARKLAEYIENHGKPVEYYSLDIFELDDEGVDLHDVVIKTFQTAFDKKVINVFCRKCGIFGHICHSTVTTFAKLRG